MVFLKKQMKRVLMVHPQYLGPMLRQTIRDQLVAEVQGISVESSGFIITVLQIADENISKGRIDHLSGSVRYEVSFDAVLFRPFKNEIMDAVVTEVTEVSAAAG
jgi:DNA-directed RNA polymerase II subunit RPB7